MGAVSSILSNDAVIFDVPQVAGIEQHSLSAVGQDCVRLTSKDNTIPIEPIALVVKNDNPNGSDHVLVFNEERFNSIISDEISNQTSHAKAAINQFNKVIDKWISLPEGDKKDVPDGGKKVYDIPSLTKCLDKHLEVGDPTSSGKFGESCEVSRHSKLVTNFINLFKNIEDSSIKMGLKNLESLNGPNTGDAKPGPVYHVLNQDQSNNLGETYARIKDEIDQESQNTSTYRP